MLPAEHDRGEALLALARTHFDPILTAIEEQALRHSCAYEDPADWDSTATLTLPDSIVEEGRDLVTGRPLAGWQGSEFRPSLLRWLLTDTEAVSLLEHRGLRVWNARINNVLDLRGCRIPVRVEFRYCLFTEQINLISAEIISLYVLESYLQKGIEGSRIHLRGPLFIEHVLAEGPLGFNSATIDGEVYLGNTELREVGTALELVNTAVRDDIRLRPHFRSAGCIDMKGVRVGGSISLSGAELSTTDQALNIDHATVHDNISLTGSFKSTGEVSMIGAEIGGILNCGGAELSSLWLDQLRINSSVYLRNHFQCNGKIRMIGAQIGGQLDCSKATIGVLEAENIEIKQSFFWQEIGNSLSIELNLIGAKIKALRDDHTSWPAKGNLEVNGLHVEDLYPLHDHDLDTTTGRIAWLNRQPDSALAEPQPWMHLAAHLESKGHRRAARRVIFELHKHQAKANWQKSKYKWICRPSAIAFAWLEEQPLRILWSILLLTTLSGSTFYRYRAHFSPTAEAAYPNVAKVASKDHVSPIAYPEFHSFVYALENVLPIVKLGQDDRWAPNPNLPNPAHPHSHLYRWLIILRWSLILLGWAQGVVLAAAVSARFRS